MLDKKRFAFGQKVEDNITGWVGMVTARCAYMDGTVQYCVVPRIDSEGKVQASKWIDSERLFIMD